MRLALALAGSLVGLVAMVVLVELTHRRGAPESILYAGIVAIPLTAAAFFWTVVVDRIGGRSSGSGGWYPRYRLFALVAGVSVLVAIAAYLQPIGTEAVAYVAQPERCAYESTEELVEISPPVLRPDGTVWIGWHPELGELVRYLDGRQAAVAPRLGRRSVSPRPRSAARGRPSGCYTSQGTHRHRRSPPAMAVTARKAGAELHDDGARPPTGVRRASHQVTGLVPGLQTEANTSHSRARSMA
jgi:hypothetical protein